MRARSWLNGARLLDVWFSLPSAIVPSYGSPDTTTIRMGTWALTFPRAGSGRGNGIRGKAGDSTIVFERPVAGWRVGDRIFIPDTGPG